MNFRSFVQSRELVWEMAKRDLFGKTKGAVLGHLWHVAAPLIQTIVYVVFVVYFLGGSRNGDSGTFAYVVYVLTGQVAWTVLSKTLQESTMLIRSQIDLVKQVIYPIETLPLTHFLVTALAATVVLAIALILAAIGGQLAWTALLLPIPVALLLLLCLGLGWILMILGVLLKDLREIVSVAMALLVFLSPVVLSESMVGPQLWSYVLLNPLAHVVIAFRDVIFGTWHPESWILFLGFTALALALGHFVVGRMKVAINELI